MITATPHTRFPRILYLLPSSPPVVAFSFSLIHPTRASFFTTILGVFVFLTHLPLLLPASTLFSLESSQQTFHCLSSRLTCNEALRLTQCLVPAPLPSVATPVSIRNLVSHNVNSTPGELNASESSSFILPTEPVSLNTQFVTGKRS
ncbi:hypothetical protein TcWFU_004311 [Taenia crassiceps]|uniref:Uncharacterized protein n=1 Tax=Taenia crassiceps TaxID=6207 RepID=A0ABR4QR68_9CEST